MRGILATGLVLVLWTRRILALPPQGQLPVVNMKRAEVTVTAPAGKIIGYSLLGTEHFRGIPYAMSPAGSQRLRPPIRLNSSLGTFDATGDAPACPQMLVSTDGNSFITELLSTLVNNPFFQEALHVDEDCLTITVTRPAGTKAGDNLPVLFWIFGGGFELGWTSMYDATSLVANSAAFGKPYIFVAVNYRVAGFGFLAGKEILRDGASNLGLLDQRQGLEWTADNIAAFGGDPEKVTIWGQSAGSISVLDQMALYSGDNTYQGKPLFRGAIMNSGSIAPTDPVDCPKAQAVYDAVVAKAGCAGMPDTLACLRVLPYDTFLRAVNSAPAILSYNSIALSYLPRPDGKVLVESPERLVATGKYAAVPMIIGSQEDEGTLFSLFQSNLTTQEDQVDYMATLFFHGATRDQLADFVAIYGNNIQDLSPFRTGIFNEIYPGFKRLAAILGDLVFTLTRRIFLATAKVSNPSVPAWSYLSSYDYGTPILGTFHGSDLLQIFYGILPNYASATMQRYYANFAYNLDPNDASGGTSVKSKVDMKWPEWDENGRQIVQVFDKSSTLLKDDFRDASYQWITNNVDSLHL